MFGASAWYVAGIVAYECHAYTLPGLGLASAVEFGTLERPMPTPDANARRNHSHPHARHLTHTVRPQEAPPEVLELLEACIGPHAHDVAIETTLLVDDAGSCDVT